MKAYYVKKDGNEVTLVYVFYEACYKKYSKDYVKMTYMIMWNTLKRVM